MLKLYTREQCQQLDHLAQQHGTPGSVLMTRAAEFALSLIQQHWPQSGHLAILCGRGNNGGDGYVLAKLAHIAGWKVSLFQIGLAPTQGDAFFARQQAEAYGLYAQDFRLNQLEQADVIVDALFGIGLNRPLDKNWQNVINATNSLAKPVLALDLPSGIDANTGQVLGAAIQAQITACFIVAKIGLYHNDGPDHSGVIHHDSLDLSTAILQAHKPTALSWDNEDLSPPIARKLNSHKGDFGRVLLIGGNHHMMGAITLAGQACLRSGAGGAHIISRQAHLSAITQVQPELMCYPDSAFFDLQAQAKVVAIGPGLGQDDWSWLLFEAACESDNSLVLDADALNMLALQPRHYDRWVLTPHPGEAARLLQKPTRVIQQDRMHAIETLHKRYGGVIVLKGCGTLVYDGEQLALCRAGNPGMAVAGMGDVLTGMISGFIAQGYSLFDAAHRAVELHARRADQLAQKYGQARLLPSDIIKFL